MHSTLRSSLLATLCLLLCFSTNVRGQSKTFVYTANAPDGSISAYSFNSSTGSLTPTPGSPFAANFPDYLAAALGGRYLVSSGGEGADCGLQVFSIHAATGALKPGHNYQVIGSVFFECVQVVSDPSGVTLYANGAVQSISSNTVTSKPVLDALRVNSDGSLTQLGNPFTFPGETNSSSAEGPIGVDPKGRWVFALLPNQNSDTLFALARHKDGSLGFDSFIGEHH